jgi:hypothetical protein
MTLVLCPTVHSQLPNDHAWLVELAKAVAKQRGYADFFDWPDKRQKELGILQTFVESARTLGLVLSNPILVEPGKDPPDAWAELPGGQRVSIELTELVDQQLVERQKRTGEAQWRAWTAAQFSSRLQQIIANKDPGLTNTRTPAAYWLVIHSGEPSLSAALVAEFVAEIRVFSSKGIERCFLLLSYEPASASCPIVGIPLSRSSSRGKG